MTLSRKVSAEEGEYLKDRYGRIDLETPTMTGFLEEIFACLRESIALTPAHSVVDIGCGRGYFLKFLENRGFSQLQGIDPCPELLQNRVFPGIRDGSFESNGLPSRSFDVAFTCHTLHHLTTTSPLRAIAEMQRIARNHIVIVEINNTNIPMFLISLLHRRVENNAMFFNLTKVRRLLQEQGLSIVYHRHLESMYLSGDSFLHKIAHRFGSSPYNICIAKVASK